MWSAQTRALKQPCRSRQSRENRSSGETAEFSPRTERSGRAGGALQLRLSDPVSAGLRLIHEPKGVRPGPAGNWNRLQQHRPTPHSLSEQAPPPTQAQPIRSGFLLLFPSPHLSLSISLSLCGSHPHFQPLTHADTRSQSRTQPQRHTCPHLTRRLTEVNVHL